MLKLEIELEVLGGCYLYKVWEVRVRMGRDWVSGSSGAVDRFGTTICV